MPASFGHDELQTLIGYLEKRRLTSDPDTSQNAVDVRDYYDASDDSTIKYIDSVNLRQSALLTERDALCRALAAVDEEAKKVDLILTRAANSRALINKIPEEILGDIFEWCCVKKLSSYSNGSYISSSREQTRVHLLGICRWWSVVLANRASIWTHIHAVLGRFNHDPKTVATMIRLRLKRAKAANIALSIFLPFGRVPDEHENAQTSDIAEYVVMRSFPRCEKLHIRYNSTPAGHPWLPLPSQFPNLNSLAITWQEDKDYPRLTHPPAFFPSNAVFPQLRDLSLSIYAHTSYRAYEIYTDPFGLRTFDVSAITSLNIGFDRVPGETWCVLEYFDSLSNLSLRRNSAWVPGPRQDPHALSGVTSRTITLESLRIATIDDVPYYSSLVRLKAPHLEELITHAPLDSNGILHEEVLQESLTQGLFSLDPPSSLLMLRIEFWTHHHIPKEHWRNFFAAQSCLEILQCACTNVLLEHIPTIPSAFPRLRLLHLGAEYAFDRDQAFFVSAEDVRTLGKQLKPLRSYLSVELPDDVAGLRVLIEFGKKSDRSQLPKGLPLSRFRVTPYDEPWSSHPEWG